MQIVAPPKPSIRGLGVQPPRIALGHAHLSVSVEITRPSGSGVVGPNQEFPFSIRAINPDRAAGGVALKNVKYNMWVENLSDPAHMPKLQVPSTPAGIVTRNFLAVNLPFRHSSLAFDPGTWVEHMCIYPPGQDLSHLDPGETDTIDLRGKAPSNRDVNSPRSFLICVQVVADSVGGEFENRFSPTFALAVV